LQQGDYARQTVFGDDPALVARAWVDQGARYLHLVDLDGARDGRPMNGKAIAAIVAAAGIPCELGGGLRHEDHLRQAFDLGITRLIIGTQALKQPEWFARMAEKFPGRLMLGIDAKAGMVATDGWLETSTCRATDLAARFDVWKLAGVVYTDINKDGMLGGPNVEALAKMTKATRLPVIASGGVTTLDDVTKLAALPLAGCIVGRAIYEGLLDLREAIQLTKVLDREKGVAS
jgi:phosphoribosylformimino-5-aminoimidazole carboxamide ribotide isomerase